MAEGYNLEKINSMMAEYLPARDGLQKTVFCAIDDAFEAGGKRIRPILMYESYRMFCERKGLTPNDDEIAPFMTGLEMIHTGSLIHDDLPCMDNDRLRRGKPTTWVSYGEDMATLAGDGLFIDAFTVTSRAAMKMKDRERGLKALGILAYKAGCEGMTGGQVVDVENTGRSLNKKQLDFIYNLKTGALLEAAMMIGAVMGGADDDETEQMRKAAFAVGRAFQIRDDILDETSTEAELGKPIHSDAENEKTTYVTLYGIEEAEKEVIRLSKEAMDILRSFKGSEILTGIVEKLTARKN